MSVRTKTMSVQFRNIRLEWRPVSALKPNPRNARIHSKKQIHQIAQSIIQFGFINPVLTDGNDNIKVGHGRFEAAKELGLDVIPTICIGHLSEAQIRAYAIADNKLALKAGWDLEILAVEFQELSALDLPFDLEITGFETAEIDLLIDGPTKTQDDPLDHLPAVETPAVTRFGDLWQLGEHKLLCADARNSSSYSELMREERARVVFADPPYNVPIDGHVGGLGSIKPRNFAMACGEMSEAQFTHFLQRVFSNVVEVSLDGAIHFICMDWRHLGEILAAGKAVYTELKNVCVWRKTTVAWAPSTALSTSLSSYSRRGRRLTSTPSSLAATGDIARMFGGIAAQTRFVRAGLRTLQCIRRSSRWHLSLTPSRTVRGAVKLYWTPLVVRAQLSLPQRNPGVVPGHWKSMPCMSTLQFAVGKN